MGQPRRSRYRPDALAREDLGMLDYRDKLTLEPWLLAKLAGEAAEGQEPSVELRDAPYSTWLQASS